MRLYPSHEKSCCDEQEYANRKRNSDGQEFNRAIGRFGVFNQGKQAGRHAQYYRQEHDDYDDFNHGTTRVSRNKGAMVTETDGQRP